MKFIYTIFFMVCTSLCVAQEYEVVGYTKRDSVETANSPAVKKSAQTTPYKPTNPPGLKMRNVGRTLTIIGGAMFIGGIVVFNNADEQYYNTYQTPQGTYQEGDPQAALGILMITGGVGMTVPGIILWRKGAKKYNRYQEREALSFNYSGSSLSFRYRFKN
jgi:hypothetical protein